MVIQDLQRGFTLSEALRQHMSLHINADDRALVVVGEESSRLAAMIKVLADRYEEQLAYRLQRILSLAQPLAMISLGILMLVVMSSLYVPLMSISYNIQ